MQTIGAQRIPFAVQSGGHASNKGFSSTKGVHISLNGFSQMELSADQSTFTYGPGHVWDDVSCLQKKHEFDALTGGQHSSTNTSTSRRAALVSSSVAVCRYVPV